MKKIRIPRKKKKSSHINKMHSYVYSSFPNTPKLQKYLHYMDVESGLKRYGISAEKLGKTFGYMTLDYVVWWAWVRYKEFGIKPNLNLDREYKEYWDYFVIKGIIKIK